MSSLLQRLALEPSRYAALPSDACERVADFLLRWQAYGEALACLEALGTLAPAQQDQRAAALHGMQRTAEAIAVLERRVAQQDSLPAAMQRLRLQAAGGQAAAALAAARSLVNRSGVRPGAGAQSQPALPLGPATMLLADILLAADKLGEAEAILLQAHKDAPASRQPLLGLMRVQQRRNDLVTASAYAMQALELAKQGPELSVEEMTELRSVLAATGDAHRVRELNQQLVTRFDRELVAMQALLANAQQLSPVSTGTAPQKPRSPHAGRETQPHTPAESIPAASDWAPVSPAAALSSITVSAKERHELAAAAKSMFGYAQLLPGQAEVLACVQRREHVLAVMPTGAGKSLCYQLPAFLNKGITLVVSPLVALMKDQIDGLPAPLRRQAVAVNSSLDGDDLRRVIERIAARHYRLVYVAPERLRQLPFIHALRTGGVARLVVDEAHCVSIWGHDFRPDYLHLAQAHLDLGGPPILAMTATAPPRVRHDIERQLLSRQAAYQGAMRVLVGDTYRPNLYLTALRVRDDEEQQEKLIALLRQLSGAGVVYVRSRKRCDELAELLIAYGVRAAAYHAGLSNRSEVQDRFMRNELAVIVATVAFGMGVDKPDIRFIVHCGLPNSVEGYYQEIGRAGRDGQMAHCVLLYSEGESRTLLRLAAGGQVATEGVRKAYAAVREVLGANPTGPVPLAAIAHAVQGTETQARTLLGVLEQTGLLLRHYDAPQTLTIQRLPQRSGRRPDGGELDRTFYDFLRGANLDTRAAASGDFLSLAAATGIAPEALESCLLSWQAAGLLRYYPAGRVPLVSLPPSPANAAQRVESLVTQRAAVAQQRVLEIDAYAHTRACRHLYLGEYLGSAPAADVRKPGENKAGQGKTGHCGVCDNCGAGLQVPDAAAGPSAADLVLGALVEQSWGRRTLIRLLRGDPEASERAQASGSYGCLRARSEQSLGQLIDSLLGEGLIGERKLEHGGVTLEATRQGLESLRPGGKNSRSRGDRRAGKPEQRPASAYARWHKKG